jgi:UDPglucose--hexose-1-phosphate uridylyltransferase
MADEDVVNILKSYKNRYEALGKKKGIEAITIFKNQGPSAGASQRHPHSQVIATPIVPPQLRNRIASAIAYFDVMGRCVFCDILESELKEGKRIILETEKFVAFIPYAPAGPFLTWIFPRRHTPSFSDIDDVELVDLAKNLKETLARLHYGLDNPDYNYTIRSMPVNEYGREYFHWYLTIVPRITQPAGFELGSGIFINASVPEECAEFLRGVNCP